MKIGISLSVKTMLMVSLRRLAACHFQLIVKGGLIDPKIDEGGLIDQLRSPK